MPLESFNRLIDTAVKNAGFQEQARKEITKDDLMRAAAIQMSGDSRGLESSNQYVKDLIALNNRDEATQLKYGGTLTADLMTQLNDVRNSVANADIYGNADQSLPEAAYNWALEAGKGAVGVVGGLGAFAGKGIDNLTAIQDKVKESLGIPSVKPNELVNKALGSDVIPSSTEVQYGWNQATNNLNDFLNNLQTDKQHALQDTRARDAALYEQDAQKRMENAIAAGEDPTYAKWAREADNFTQSAKDIATGHGGVTDAIANAIGSVGVFGKVAGGANKVLRIAAGAEKSAVETALANAGTDAIARMTAEQMAKRGVAADLATTGLTSGAVTAGSAINQAYDRIAGMTEADLLANPNTKERNQQLINELGLEGAKAQLANEASNSVAAPAFLAGVPLGLLNSRFDLNPAAHLGREAIIPTMLREGGQETLEEGFTKYAENKAVNHVTGNQDNLTGVGQAAAQGLIGGLGSPVIAPINDASNYLSGVKDAVTKSFTEKPVKANPVATEFKTAQQTANKGEAEAIIQNPSASPQDKQAAEYIQKLQSNLTLNTTGMRENGVPSEIVDTLDQQDNLFSAVEALAEFAHTGKADQATKDRAAIMTLQVMDNIQNLLDEAPKGTDVTPYIADYQNNLVTTLRKLHSSSIGSKVEPMTKGLLGRALESGMVSLDLENVPEDAQLDNLTTLLNLAKANPTEVPDAVHEALYAVSKSNSYNLTKAQKADIQAINAHYSTARDMQDNLKSAGLDAMALVNKGLVTEEENNTTKKPSAAMFVKRIVSATQKGDFKLAYAMLTRLGNLAQHMQNKADALAAHKSQLEKTDYTEGVYYAALMPDGTFKTSRKPVSYQKNNPTFANTVTAEAKLVSDIYRKLYDSIGLKITNGLNKESAKLPDVPNTPEVINEPNTNPAITQWTNLLRKFKGIDNLNKVKTKLTKATKDSVRDIVSNLPADFKVEDKHQKAFNELKAHFTKLNEQTNTTDTADRQHVDFLFKHKELLDKHIGSTLPSEVSNDTLKSLHKAVSVGLKKLPNSKKLLAYKDLLDASTEARKQSSDKPTTTTATTEQSKADSTTSVDYVITEEVKPQETVEQSSTVSTEESEPIVDTGVYGELYKNNPSSTFFKGFKLNKHPTHISKSANPIADITSVLLGTNSTSSIVDAIKKVFPTISEFDKGVKVAHAKAIKEYNKLLKGIFSKELKLLIDKKYSITDKTTSNVVTVVLSSVLNNQYEALKAGVTDELTEKLLKDIVTPEELKDIAAIKRLSYAVKKNAQTVNVVERLQKRIKDLETIPEENLTPSNKTTLEKSKAFLKKTLNEQKPVIAKEALKAFQTALVNLSANATVADKVYLVKAKKLSKYKNGRLLELAHYSENGYPVLDSKITDLVSIALASWSFTVDTYPSISQSRQDIADALLVEVSSVPNELVTAFNTSKYRKYLAEDFAKYLKQYLGVTSKNTAYLSENEGLLSALATSALLTLNATGSNLEEISYETQLTPLGEEESVNRTFTLVRKKPMEDSPYPDGFKVPSLVEQLLHIDNEDKNHFSTDTITPPEMIMHSQVQELTPKEKLAVEKANEIGNTLFKPVIQLYKAIGIETLVRLFGDYRALSNAPMNTNTKASAEGLNLSLTNAYEKLLQVEEEAISWADLTEQDINDIQVFYPKGISNVARLQYLGGNTNQSSKLIRQAITPTVSKLNLKSSTEVDKFFETLAQALGIKSHNNSPTDNIRQVKAYLELPAVQNALKVLTKHTENPTEPLSENDNARLNSALSKTDRTFRALAALLDYSNYLTAVENGDSTVEIATAGEADGVNNGQAGALHLFADTPSERLIDLWERTGFVLGDTVTALHDTRKEDKRDIYALTGELMSKTIPAIIQKSLKTVETVLDNLRKNPEKKKAAYVIDKKKGIVPLVLNSPTKLLALLSLKVNFNESGELVIDRGVTKNPITISTYGAGNAGISNNMVNAILDELYSKITDHLQATDKRNSWYAQNYKEVNTLLNHITTPLTIRPPNPLMGTTGSVFIDESKLTLPNPANLVALEKFTLKPKDFQVASDNMGSVFTNALIQAGDTLYGDVRANIDKLSKIHNLHTSLMSVRFQRLFNELVDHEMLKNPEFTTNDLPSKKAIIDLQNSVVADYAGIHGDEWVSLYTAKTDDIVKNTGIATTADSANSVDLSLKGIAPSGVKAAGATTIARNDSIMIIKALLDKKFPKQSLLVFDGVEFTPKDITTGSEVLNKAVFESWVTTDNPLKLYANTFKQLIEKAEYSDVDSTIIPLLRELEIKAESQKEFREGLAELHHWLETKGDAIDKFQKVVATLSSSTDQMAGFNSPYVHVGKSLSGNTPKEKAEALTKLLKGEEDTKATSSEFIHIPVETEMNAKDAEKFKNATKLIAYGVKGTSTYNYAEANPTKTNVGTYNQGEMVALSLNGISRPKAEANLKLALKEAVKALESGAYVIGDKAGTAKGERDSAHNTATEGKAAKFFAKRGYVETELGNGVWFKPEPKNKKPKPKSTTKKQEHTPVAVKALKEVIASLPSNSAKNLFALLTNNTLIEEMPVLIAKSFAEAKSIAESLYNADTSNYSKDTTDVLGLFDPLNDLLLIADGSETTISHEIIHAITLKTMVNVTLGNTEGMLDSSIEEVITATKNIDSLMRQFLNITSNDLQGQSEKLKTEIEHTQNTIKDLLQESKDSEGVDDTKSKVKYVYALNEFMAYSLSSTIKDYLKETPIKTKLLSFSRGVINAIKKILGIKSITSNVFDTLEFNTGIIVKNNVWNTTLDTPVYVRKSSELNTKLDNLENIVTNEVSQDSLDVAVEKGETATSSIQNSLLGLSQEELDTFKRVYTIVDSGLIKEGIVLNELNKVFAHTLRVLTPSHLTKAVHNNPTIDTEIKRDYLKSLTKGGLTNFIALSVSSEYFQNILSSLPEYENISTDVVDTPNSTIDGIVISLGNKLLEAITPKVMKLSGNTEEVVDTLTTQLLEGVTVRNLRTKNKLSNLNKRLDNLNTQIQTKLVALGNVAESKIAEKETYLGKANNLVMGSLALLFNNEFRTGVVNDFKTALHTKEGYNSLRHLYEDIVGRTDENHYVYDLIKPIRTFTDKARQFSKEHIPVILESKFKSISQVEKNLLLKGMVAVNMASFGVASTLPLLRNLNNLPSEIDKVTTKLSTFEHTNIKQIKRDAKVLAKFMMTGIADNGLKRNATHIGMDYITATDGGKSSWSYINLISRLTTLYALEYLTEAEKTNLTNLALREPEGVRYYTGYLEAIHLENKRKLDTRPDQILNADEATAYQLLDDATHTVTLLTEEQGNELEELGYKRVGNYKGELDDEEDNLGYYIVPTINKGMFSSGVLQTVGNTAYGINLNTSTSISPYRGGIIKSSTEFDLSPSVEGYVPVYNGMDLIGYERLLDPKKVGQYIPPQDPFKLAAAMYGRQVEERSAETFNKTLIDSLIKQYKANTNKQEFIKLFDTKAPHYKDPVVENAIDRIGFHLKYQMETAFKEAGIDGVRIHRSVLDDVIGYQQANVLTDAYTGVTRLHPKVSEAIKEVTTALLGKDAYSKLSYLSSLVQVGVSYTKDTIVVKSLVVPFSNIVSNIGYLLAEGVPLKTITKYAPVAIAELRMYSNLVNQQLELEAKLQAQGKYTNSNEYNKTKAQLDGIHKSIQDLSIYPLIANGELSNITDSGMNVTEFNLDKVSEVVNNTLNKIPKEGKSVIKQLLITKDTALYKGLAASVIYGDFVAKAVLYKHLVEHLPNEDMVTTRDVLNRVSSDFGHYDRLAGRTRDALEGFGLAWFLNYKLRLAKTTHRMIRKRPLSALMSVAGSDLLGIDLPVTSTIQASLIEGTITNSLGTDMLLHGISLNPYYNLAT